jgi:hypothetical protein
MRLVKTFHWSYQPKSKEYKSRLNTPRWLQVKQPPKTTLKTSMPRLDFVGLLPIACLLLLGDHPWMMSYYKTDTASRVLDLLNLSGEIFSFLWLDSAKLTFWLGQPVSRPPKYLLPQIWLDIHTLWPSTGIPATPQLSLTWFRKVDFLTRPRTRPVSRPSKYLLPQIWLDIHTLWPSTSVHATPQLSLTWFRRVDFLTRCRAVSRPLKYLLPKSELIFHLNGKYCHIRHLSELIWTSFEFRDFGQKWVPSRTVVFVTTLDTKGFLEKRKHGPLSTTADKKYARYEADRITPHRLVSKN